MPMPKVVKPRIGNHPETQEAWPMTLQTAIQIGLDNSEIVRVIAFGAQGIPVGGIEPTPSKAGSAAPASDAKPAPIVIARLNADAAPSRFKAEIMAHVRSVEQTYWALAQARVRLSAADRAVSLAVEILNKEQAELSCHGGVADAAEAAQRLEQFKRDQAARRSDVTTSERQLRFILGLPPADNRYIIPVTPLCETKFEPVWDTCLHEMLEHSPEIVRGKAEVRELRDAIAVAAANATVAPLTFRSGQQWRGIAKDNPEDRQRITQKEAELEQTIKRQTESLARMFRYMEANRTQLQKAKGLRLAAAARLQAQRAYYDEGRITAERFLDAVSQQATAAGTEAMYLATYNTSIVGLKEAKGTLLADDGIEVAEPRRPGKALAAQHGKTDAAAQPAAFVAEPKNAPAPPSAPTATSFPPIPGLEMVSCGSKQAETKAATASWSFSFTIGSGPGAVQIKGTISGGDYATSDR